MLQRANVDIEATHVHNARVRAVVDLQVLQGRHGHWHGIVRPANILQHNPFTISQYSTEPTRHQSQFLPSRPALNRDHHP